MVTPGQRCKVPGCTKPRLRASELCPEHLDVRLRLDREAREQVRPAAGSWAAWLAPQPTISQVAGLPPTPEEEARVRAREEAIRTRAEVSRRLEAEARRIPWPSLLDAIGPAGLAKRLEKALRALPPEREAEAWRTIASVLDATAEGRGEAVAKLEGAVREPAQALLDALSLSVHPERSPGPTEGTDRAESKNGRAPDPSRVFESLRSELGGRATGAVRDAVLAAERLLAAPGRRPGDLEKLRRAADEIAAGLRRAFEALRGGAPPLPEERGEGASGA